ncbi:MAG: VOC family protein [Alphaproteobacteria bacterium]
MRPVLTHLALQVRDLRACVAFYRDYCGLEVVREREGGVTWLAEPGRGHEFILVLLPGGEGRDPRRHDFGHLGYACASRAEVDAVADKARGAGTLVWEPREEPYPVGYYCGVSDPDGNFVEFSYGQPLGPGAPAFDESSREDERGTGSTP